MLSLKQMEEFTKVLCSVIEQQTKIFEKLYQLEVSIELLHAKIAKINGIPNAQPPKLEALPQGRNRFDI